MATPSTTLWFDPDEHPKECLKAFENFCKTFDRRYQAQYPDPPKTSMDAAIQRWKVEHITPTDADPALTLNDFDAIRDKWISRDKVTKLIGMFSAARLAEDWEAAETDAAVRKVSGWDEFQQQMKNYYKPTENINKWKML